MVFIKWQCQSMQGEELPLCLECFPVFEDYCKCYPTVSNCPFDWHFLVSNHWRGSSWSLYCQVPISFLRSVFVPHVWVVFFSCSLLCKLSNPVRDAVCLLFPFDVLLCDATLTAVLLLCCEGFIRNWMQSGTGF